MAAAMQQLVRFNEGLDQAITESIARYTDELEKSRDLFLAALGHDVRTPLAAISITAETLLRDPSDANRDRGARILRSTRILGSIANDLLDFTRTRMGGEVPLQVAPMDARDVTEGVLKELSQAYPERRVALHASGDSTLDGDPARIAQALTNLVLNALQHGSADGAVAVEIGSTADALTIAVRNGGESIPAERLEHLFQPWMRPHGSPHTGNSGLGLYIVRQIVHAHDGTIKVQSSAKEGTTFTLHLPRTRLRPLERPRQ